MNWAGRSVMITGASGFTGGWLLRRLAGEGARVIAPLRGAMPEAYGDLAAELTAFDLTDVESLVRVLNEHGVETVFHLAARTIADAASADPHATFEVNVRGTYSLLEAVRRVRSDGLDTRIVVASTYHVYGARPGPYREDQPLRPEAPYDVSKACADMLARSYGATYGLPVAVTRLANVYGGGDREDSRLVAAAARALVERRAPVIRSDGTPERDFIYAEDAVDAYLAAAESLERQEMWGRAWNAGADRPIAVAELVRRLAAAGGSDIAPQVEGRPRPGAAPDRRYLDSSAIRGELGWEPRWSLDDGLAATYRWYADAAA